MTKLSRPVDARRVCLDSVIFWHHKPRIVDDYVDYGSRVTNFVVG